MRSHNHTYCSVSFVKLVHQVSAIGNSVVCRHQARVLLLVEHRGGFFLAGEFLTRSIYNCAQITDNYCRHLQLWSPLILKSMESGDGDWRTPKVSHVRPTVRHHLHQVQQALGSNSDSSPGVPAQASTPFPPLEEGPLTPSTNPTPQMPPTIERRVGRIEEEVQSIAGMYCTST